MAKGRLITRRMLMACICVSGVIVADVALAFERRQVVLDYVLEDGAGGCPGRGALTRGVKGLLGYDPFVEDGQGRVLVRLSAQGLRHVATLRVSSPEGEFGGERRVEARVRACDEMIDAIALTVSLALDPEAVERVKRPRRSSAWTERRRPRRGSVSSPPSTRAAPPEAEAEGAPLEPWWLGVSGGLSGGATPALAPRVGASARYAQPWWSMGAELHVDIPLQHEVVDGAISGQCLTLTLSACLRWRWLSGCLLARGGVLMLSGHDYPDAQRAVAPYGAGGARLGFETPLNEGLSLALNADVEFPFWEIRARVGQRVPWSVSAVVGAATLGLKWRL